MFDLLHELWNAVRYLKLIYPALLLAAAWGAWRLPRQGSRRVVVLSLGALLALSWMPFSWLNNYLLEAPYRDIVAAPAADAIVVLSGASEPPSDRFPYTLALESTVRRTRYAAALALERPETPVLACGPGRDDDPSASSVAFEMGELLAGWGVERERIWLEEVGVSTASQSAEAAAILRAKGVRRILLVTDAFHMRRAEGCFRKQGFETYAAPSQFRARFDLPTLPELLPSPGDVRVNEEAFREWLALAVYKARGVI